MLVGFDIDLRATLGDRLRRTASKDAAAAEALQQHADDDETKSKEYVLHARVARVVFRRSPPIPSSFLCVSYHS